MNTHATQPRAAKLGFTITAVICAVMAIFAAVLMTEPGQLLNLDRDWIVSYYQYKLLYSIVVLSLFAGLIVLHKKYGIWPAPLLWLCGAGVVLCLYVSNALLDHFFPTKHKNAVYVSIEQADTLLDDQETVYAVEIEGEAVAYPRRFLEIPHVAGKNIGGQDVAMTFCALSNLPVVYDSRLDNQEAHFGILIQTNNNLVLYDEHSGELIQQISGETEFGAPPMKTHANQMMSWSAFKEIYPQGEVFEYKFDRWLDNALLSVFEDGLKKQFDPNSGPLFPTLRLDDDRLPSKEQVWGLNINGEQLVYARSFFDKQPTHNSSLGGLDYVASYNAKHDVVSFFQRDAEIHHTDVDVYGQSSAGKLERLPSYNGVFWMVWSHFYPDSKVLK